MDSFVNFHFPREAPRMDLLSDVGRTRSKFYDEFVMIVWAESPSNVARSKSEEDLL